MKRAIFISVLMLSSQALWAKVMLGIDVLEKNKFDLLEGKSVGLITNHTGVNGQGKSTIDILSKAPGVKLVKLFSPEHGIRGDALHGQTVVDGKDPVSGLSVLSLYGRTQRPTPEMLNGIDVLVFDIQDIGTRFYTYTTTLAYALEEAAKAGIEFIVLDRPNPITGSIVEGEPLDDSINHFTAYLRVPVRHGMTVGELANWHCKTKGLKVKLTVVMMQGWQREMWWENTGLKFRPTSPNIRTVTAATLYPGIGGFEATNLSVGRGTSRPFEVFGAPWLNAKVLVSRLSFFRTPGFEFQSADFKPKSDLYAGEECQGIKVILKDREAARPVDLFVVIFTALQELHPKKFKARWDEMPRITGSDRFEDMLERGQSAETINTQWRDEAQKFIEKRKEYLLYGVDDEEEEVVTE
ncbi:MAG: hypothetical protein A2901_01895 [Elusimicrobia bacterium RIFCSPLOWO2_01_FULL_54_10]|nr:MAG: hypothetical protein A2901_01895 [Elusimicrobia bacterium RIFCSPLOWO2_01_FULL_54_10]